MTRRIKALGLAVVAVAAMSMAAASAAQATELHGTHNADVVVTGEQVEKLKLQITHQSGGVSTQCSTINFEGTHPWQQGTQITTDDVTLTPTVSGCQSAGLAAVVRMNGCKLTMTGKNTDGSTAGGQPGKTGNVDIVGCTAGKQMESIAGGGACVIKTGEQSHLPHVVFSNTTEAGKPHHVHLNLTLTGITYQTQGAACIHPSGTTMSDAQFQGQATFRAYQKIEEKQVTEHNHQFNKNVHNNVQVGVLAT